MNGLFQTLLRPDREEDPERSVVARAANILQIGEFQLLQLAYHEWYGASHLAREPDPPACSEAYMLHGEVPHLGPAIRALRIIRQDEIDADRR